MTSIDNLFLMTLSGQSESGTVPPEGRRIIVPAGQHVDISLLLLRGNADIHVVLTGKQASCRIQTVYLSCQNNRNNLNLEVIHESPETTSEQIIKGIVTDTAYTAFHGIIRMPHQAQQCVGSQNHRAVLLTPQAVVTATPELEIYADDVQCAHGSAIGALDTAALFYLMSRGIAEKTARHILLQAMINDSLPPSFEPVVQEWMAQHA